MKKFTSLYQNPSFDLDFIGKVVHTESSYRNYESCSLPKLNSRHLTRKINTVVTPEPFKRNKSVQVLSEASSKFMKKTPKDSQLGIIREKKSEEIEYIMNVKKYGKWF